MEMKFKDVRGRRIIFLAHCTLNQNAMVEGLAEYPGMVKPIVELLLEHDIAVFQMPCPEMTYIGAMRWSHVRDQYNSPMFRSHCVRIAEKVLDQVEEYSRTGYQILGFVMKDGSPACGLNTTHVADKDSAWGGRINNLPKGHYGQDRGVFCEIVMELLKRRDMESISFISLPEKWDSNSMIDALREIRMLI